jgi:cytochrome c553
MKKTILIMISTVALAAAAALSCTQSSSGDHKTKPPVTKQEMIQRGSYLVNAMGCDDCHSPKRMGPNGPEIIEELRFSGHSSSHPIMPVDTNIVKQGWSLFGPEFTNTAGMWGQSFAANLTSDETGIGNWKEEQFIKAIRQGLYKGLDNSRPLLPPMPWFVYKNLSDDDLKSIFAYLKSTKPVHNVVPAPIPFSELGKIN